MGLTFTFLLVGINQLIGMGIPGIFPPSLRQHRCRDQKMLDALDLGRDCGRHVQGVLETVNCPSCWKSLLWNCVAAVSQVWNRTRKKGKVIEWVIAAAMILWDWKEQSVEIFIYSAKVLDNGLVDKIRLFWKMEQKIKWYIYPVNAKYYFFKWR